MGLLSFLPPAIRTRLRDMAFGRPRLQVLDASQLPEDSVRPVFVLGCFRSGTTLLRYLLDTHSELCCPPETKFMRHLAALRDDPESVRALQSMGYDDQYLRTRLRALADDFYLPYMAARGKRRWADKTPEYMHHLEFIDWLYDSAVDYLVIHRNGLDVTNSMLQNRIVPLEPDKTLDSAFDYWHESASILLDWERTHPDNTHVVRYETLCREPGRTMDEVFGFVGLEPEDVVRRWHSEHHDMGYEDAQARRRETISMKHATFASWPEADQQRLKARACDIHRQMGYDPDTLMPL